MGALFRIWSLIERKLRDSYRVLRMSIQTGINFEFQVFEVAHRPGRKGAVGISPGCKLMEAGILLFWETLF